jgi:hypothetical protein
MHRSVAQIVGLTAAPVGACCNPIRIVNRGDEDWICGLDAKAA